MLLSIISQKGFSSVEDVWSDLGFGAAWKMDELSGDLLPALGSNNLEDANTPLYDQSISGYAFKGVDTTNGEFSGTPSDFAMSGNGEITFSCLVEVGASTAGNQFLAVIDKTPWEIRLATTFQIQNAGAGLVDTGISVSPNTSYKMCLVMSAVTDTITFYLNNDTFTKTSAGITIPASPLSAVVGAQDLLNNNTFKGKIALSATKQGTITESQKNSLFNAIDNGV